MFMKNAEVNLKKKRGALLGMKAIICSQIHGVSNRAKIPLRF